MANRPGFFKFYIPSLGEENQKIPPTFVARVQDTWTTDFNLRDKYNNLWNVKVEMKDGYWYFRDGWEKFIDDNRIRGGYMVLYEYFSPGLLDFKVHNRFACSTEGVGGRIEESSEERESDDDETDHDPIDEGENARDDDADNDDHDSSAEEENREDDEADNDDHHSSAEEENGQDEGTDDATNSVRRGGRRDPGYRGADIFETGLVPRPRNPYFVSKPQKTRPRELYLPKDVIRCYNLQLPQTVTLHDPHGRQFIAELNTWSDGRMHYKGGWKTLCQSNMVEGDDRCICEFLGNGDDLSIRVSFYPPK